MAWVKRKPNGKFLVEWRKLNGDPESRIASTHSAAKHLKADVEACRTRGIDWQPSTTGDEPLIEEIATAYIKKRATKLRGLTLRSDANALEVFKRFTLTKSKRPTVSMLSKPLMDEYLVWLAQPETALHNWKRKEQGLPIDEALRREGATINKVFGSAQRMWVWAENSGRWPEDAIPRPRLLDKSEIPMSHPGAVVAPTWEEMDACIRHALTPNLRRLAVWLRLTGLRVGESMLIEWRDIDMKRGELTIRPEVDKKKIGRVVPLCKLALEEIATWGKREGYLLPSARKIGTPREREARARDMARCWARAGVREAVWKRRPDHAFRRGIKSGLLEAGAHPDAVDYLQGHGSGSRWRYIDPARLPLAAALALIPDITTTPDLTVVGLPAADQQRTAAAR